MYDVNWHRLPPLTTLRAFEATARLKGYSAAARALNVTPAAIAQQVRKLETDVGTALVRREGRGLALTDSGRQLALPLREAFSLIARGFEEVKLSQTTRGVRVSTTDYFGNEVVLPSMGDFWAQYPGAQVSFSPEGNTQPVDLERFDIVIRGAADGASWEGYQETPLIRSPMIITAAPSLIGEGPIDLASLPWVKETTIGGDVFERMVRRAGCDPDAIEIVDPGSPKFELEAVLLGYGLNAGPEVTIRKHLADGSLVRVGPPLEMSGVYYAITRKGPLDAVVLSFLGWLRSLCADIEKELGAERDSASAMD